jgi:hypothetical protein
MTVNSKSLSAYPDRSGSALPIGLWVMPQARLNLKRLHLAGTNQDCPVWLKMAELETPINGGPHFGAKLFVKV